MVGGLLSTERTPLGALKREPIRAYKRERRGERRDRGKMGWGPANVLAGLSSWDKLYARSLEILFANNIGQAQVPVQITCAEGPPLNRVERQEQVFTGTSSCEFVVLRSSHSSDQAGQTQRPNTHCRTGLGRIDRARQGQTGPDRAAPSAASKSTCTCTSK